MSESRTSDAVCELSQRFYFEAAHTLQRSVDKESSQRIHGHSYEAEVTLAGPADPATGMLVDLAQLRAEIGRVREMLDHRLLDEVDGLGRPTLENLCAFIRRHLEPRMPLLRAVMVERRVSADRCVLRWG